MVPKPAMLGITALLLAQAAVVSGQAPTGPRDPYSRLIARSDAVVLGRVLAAGLRDVPVPGSVPGVVTTQGFARIAVERWILGPDTDSTLELRLGSNDPGAVRILRNQLPPSDGRVILYLLRSRGEWWIARELVWNPGRPMLGIEALPARQASERVAAILRAGAACSPESLAARADLAVVGSLTGFMHDAPAMTCRVERVVFGTATDSVLTVLQPTPPDLRLGPVLLLLKARPDSCWELLDERASCFYLDQDRVAHSLAPLDTVLVRLVAAHSGGPQGANAPAR